MPPALLALLKVLVLAVVVAYLVAIAALYLLQERIIFPGDPLPPDHVFRFDQRFEELAIPVPGATLSALHFRQPSPRGLVFFIHGNAGNLETWTAGVDFYRRVGYDLFIFDFRGYGKSTGRIDSEAQLAAQTHPALLVLVTPYTSLGAIARRAYPWAPGALLKYPLRTEAAIADVRSPILLVHGTHDLLIPITESRALLARARAPAKLLTIEGASHNDVHEFPLYLDTLEARLRSVAGAAP